MWSRYGRFACAGWAEAASQQRDVPKRCPWELGWAMLLVVKGKWKVWNWVAPLGPFARHLVLSCLRLPWECASAPRVQVLTWCQMIQLTAFNQPLKSRLFFFLLGFSSSNNLPCYCLLLVLINELILLSCQLGYFP